MDGAAELYERAVLACERGDRAETERLAVAALAAAPDRALRVRLQHLRGLTHARGPAPLRGYELLLTEAEGIAAADAHQAVLMLADAAMLAFAGGERKSALATNERGLALARRAAPELVPLLRLGHGILRSFEPHPGDARAEMRAAIQTLDAEELERTWEMLQLAAAALLWLEEYEVARELAEAVVGRARATGLREPLPVALDTLATLDFRLGRWTAADARSTEALRLARELEQTGQAASCLTTLAAIASARGDGRACREYAEQALALREAFSPVEAWARTALAVLALSRGHAEEAIAELEPLLASEQLPDPAVDPWLGELVEAYARTRRGEQARALVEQVAPQLEASGQAGLRALAAHCRGLVAEVGAFEDAFEQALAWHTRSRMPFPRARTELAYGARLRRVRRNADAKTHLELALAAFERLGARAWAERARAELASGRPARGTARLRDLLTPHELEVALLVGHGATNKEAAAALFVSPKTVDYHLVSIYRKLDLRSRSELAARVARDV